MAVVWSAAPEWIRDRLEREGRDRLGREVRVTAVELSLSNLSLRLQGVSIAGAEKAGPTLLAFESLDVDVDGSALWRGRVELERLHWQAPRGRLTRGADGRFDIDDILQRLAAAPAARDDRPKEEPSSQSPLPAVVLRDLAVRDGQWEWEDRITGQRHQVSGLSLVVPRISTREDDRDVPVEPSLAFALNGAPVKLSAALRPFAVQPGGHVSLSVQGLDLSHFWPGWTDALPVRPKGGRLELSLDTRVEKGGTAGWQWGLSGRVAVEDVAAHHPDGGRLAGLRSLSVALQDVRPLERRVALGDIVIDGAQVDVRRDRRGRIDVLGLLEALAGARPAAAATAVAAPPPVVGVGGAAGGASGSGGEASPPWTVEVASVALRGARLQWRDEAVAPVGVFAVDVLDARAGPVQWPTSTESTPWPVSLQATIQEGSSSGRLAPVARLSLQGQADDRRARVDWRLDEARLSAGATYVRPLLQAALEGVLQARGRAEWTAGDAAKTVVSVQEGRVEGLSWMPQTGAAKAQPSTALRVDQLMVRELLVDLSARRVALGQVAVQRPGFTLRRQADGRLAGLSSADPGASSAAVTRSPPPGVDAKPWQVRLNRVALSGGTVDWVDEVPARSREGAAPLRLGLRDIVLTARDVDWPPRAAAIPLELSAQMPAPAAEGAPPAPPGRLQFLGRLGMSPWAGTGSLRVERFPLHAFEPYLTEQMPVRLSRAELGVQLELDGRLEEAGPTVQVRGQALLADVLVQTPRPGEPCLPVVACLTALVDDENTLAAWNALTFQGLDLALAPGQRPRLSLQELRLADFFARLVVTPEGRLNLQRLAGDDAGQEPTQPKSAEAPVAPAVPGTPPTPSAAAPPKAPANPWPIDLTVQRTVLSNGRVDFNDRFIRPNYSADLSELNGTLGRFESGSSQMATLELRGRAARTALLEIRGAVNPTANPLALDLSARVTDLELAPLSAYSGKYAGYAIERGKLSFDLAYRIDPDGKLQARNQIILNQLTLGDKVDSPSATKLPVRLALYLLSDRNGVIDIDLPISGSINDPQFSIWGIVWKVIGNLIVKVVTAPFAWLTGGSGPDASQVEFVPGTARIALASTSAIEKVARALNDRPRLRMTVTGAADPQSERQAIQEAVFESRLRALMDRDRARAAGDGAPAAAPGASAVPGSASMAGAPAVSTPAGAPLVDVPAVGTPQRESLVRRLFAQSPPPSLPSPQPGAAPRPSGSALTPDLMEAQIKAAIAVTPDSARELALQRGLSVRDALIARGLPAERLFLASPQVRTPEESEAAWVPRVQLTIDGR